MLEEIDPSRAARSHDRQFYGLVARQESFQAFQDLGAFLHDGQVGGEVGVEDLGEAQVLEGGHQFAGDDRTGLHAEFLAEGDADGRSGLRDDDLVGIAEVVEQTVGIVTLGQGAGRADRHALAAVGAVRILEHPVEGRGDGGVETAADGTQHTHRLNGVAHTLAAAAEDALVHVARDGGRHLFLAGRLFATLERHLADIEAHYQALQFAVAALGAGKAIVRVIGEHELGDGLAGADHAGGVGLDHHAFHTHRSAGRGQVAASLHFHDADTAGSGVVLHAGALEVDVAERGDVDADGLSSIEEGRPGSNGHRDIVYGKFDFFVHDASRLR